MHFAFPLSVSASVRRWRIALLFPVLVCAGSLVAAEKEGPPQLSEKTGEIFTKIAPLSKDQKWKEVLEVLDAAIPTLAPNSIDLAEILSSKGIAHLQIEDYSGALQPLENALKISDAHGFFDKGKTLQIMDILARLNAQEAQSAKTPATQEPFYAKSVNYLKRILTETPKPRVDTRMLYAQILVQYATVNSERINTALIKEAKSEVEKVLYSTIKPTESMYQLLQFAVQQEGDLEKSAQILELMVSLYPTKSSYWQTLMGTYATLAQTNEKSPERYRQYYIRAINTIERAQPYGFLKAPKDQFNLVTMYTIVGQFGRSTELLHTGLRNGTIESDVKNWLQLAYAYQQAHLDLEAINALKEAVKLFPKSGLLDLSIGNIYYGVLEDFKNANLFFKSAWEKKGDVEPSKFYGLARAIAFTSLELGQLDEALKYLEEAGKLEEAAKDSTFARMVEHIKALIAERDEKSNPSSATPATTPKNP